MHELAHSIRSGAREKVLPNDTNKKPKIVPLLRPQWLDKEIWPFQTSGMKVDGNTIAVTDVGSGPVLLFVHTGLWSFIWRDVMLRLAPDFRCICFDSPGTGLSDRVPRHNISLENAAMATAAVIDALDLRDFTLLVHDLGGPVGTAGTAQFPERVNGIAAVNAFAWKPTDIKLRLGLRLIGSAVVRELDVLTGVVPRITSTSFGVGSHMDPSSRDAFRSGIGREGLRAFHQYIYAATRGEGIYDTISAALRGPFRPLPLITIFGKRNDPFGFQQLWKELYPDATQVVIPKGNHFPMCDAPEFVAETLRIWHRDRVLAKQDSEG
jgi:Predicted hydrolases or acyltransferases (alpha/beta hydrolase superfamily)